MTATATRPTTPPGPRGLPYVGCALSYMRDPFGYMTHIANEYGDVVRSTFAGSDIFQLNHPDHVEHVLLRNRNNYVKDRFLRSLKTVVGEGLLTSEGDLWRGHRKQMAAAFTPRRVNAYAPVVTACARDLQAGWEDGQTIDLGQDMMHLTLQVAVQTLFGSRVAAADVERVGAAFAVVNEYYTRMVGNLPLWIPSPRNRAFLRAKAELESVVDAIIAERQRDGGDGGDLLSALLRSDMSARHLRDQVLTLLLAGHETTALTLTYTLHLLATHPEVERAVLREVEAVLGGRDPAVDDLPRLELLRRVVRESLRLYPPAAVIGREALADDEIGGYRIPQGSVVVMPQWVIQRDPRWFDEPAAFRPERWTADACAALPRFAYFPFGGGKRVCIGEAFALLETSVALAALLQRHRFEPVDPEPIETVSAITMRPRRAVLARVSARSPAHPAASAQRAGVTAPA